MSLFIEDATRDLLGEPALETQTPGQPPFSLS
jgi:hypothetical protein